jgi:threonine/homoserine/homoserine lactone efflux protein
MVPAAIAVATSPIPVVAIVLVLATPRARVNGAAFAAAWVIGLAAAATLAMAIVGGPEADDGPSAVAGWVQVIAGVAFLALAVRTWQGRPVGDADPEMPAWLATIDALSVTRIVGLGLLLSAANPKNLALTFAAVSSIREAATDDAQAVVAAAAFVALASSSVVLAVVAHLVAADRAARALASVKGFMIRHNTAIALVILVLLGAKFLADGIAALT